LRARFSTSSTVNVAELISLCAEKPGRRVLNAVDHDNLSVAEIAHTIFQTMGRDIEIVTYPGPAVGNLGSTPWSVTHPLIMSMDAATVELGYRQPVSYADAVAEDIDWVTREVAAAERREQTWQDVFPSMVTRSKADGWFDYAAEDEYFASRAKAGPAH